jgi:hypothetical protein
MQVNAMSQREFNYLLNSLNALSPEQLATLRRELDRKMASPLPAAAKWVGKHAEQTVFDVMVRSGLIGCLKGMPHTPTDLSTNPKHMEGFGRG